MTYEQKLMACKVIAPAHLEMSRPQWWHVVHSVEIQSAGLLKGRFGAGIDPQSAIDDHWRKITSALEPQEYIVTSFREGKRRAYRWAEFMWLELDEEEEARKTNTINRAMAQLS